MHTQTIYVSKPESKMWWILLPTYFCLCMPKYFSLDPLIILTNIFCDLGIKNSLILPLCWQKLFTRLANDSDNIQSVPRARASWALWRLQSEYIQHILKATRPGATIVRIVHYIFCVFPVSTPLFSYIWLWSFIM